MALTVVTYHYVRDLASSRYPSLTALDASKFDGQLDYITRHYQVVGLDLVRSVMKGQEQLPPNACLLTFDDGLIDHFTVVFPRLIERGIAGCFFPPVKAVKNRRVLDVHKIHFVLASDATPDAINRYIMDACDGARAGHDLPSREDLLADNWKASRFDSAEVRFVKNVLQKGLPEPFRSELVAQLFATFVTDREDAFSADLYMDDMQLRCMIQTGMEVGGHGAFHDRLGLMSRPEQEEEVRATQAFLAELYGHELGPWSIAYPYGSFNSDTLEILEGAGCVLGFTIEQELVQGFDSPLTLGRVDTNYLPFEWDAAPPSLREAEPA